MNTEFCEYEDVVTAALLDGRFDGALLGHVAGCPHCGELKLTLQCLAQAAPATEDMPTCGLIWWRAQLAERRERAQRAVAAIELMQKLAVGFALIVLCAVGWFWGRDVFSVYLNTLLTGAGIFLATAAVLYGWARGRI